MAIASNLPFQLLLKNRYQSKAEMEAERFFASEDEAWNCEDSTLSIEENDEVELLFSAKDKDARLYVEVLYGMPFTEQVGEDSEGRRYLKPQEDYLFLYQSNNQYESLWVDVFLMTVVCEGKAYYGTLEVMPKQMDMAQWLLMKEELEEEVKGLTKNLVLRDQAHITKATDHGEIPNEALLKYLLIKDQAKSVMAALMDIADRPKSQIITTYDMVPAKRAHVFDRETARRYVRTGGRESNRKVPVKMATYDIPANQMLKQMIACYENELDEFLSLIRGNPLYSKEWDTACKLRKLTSYVKQKSWYKEVSAYKESTMTHSFLMDSRYHIVYGLYSKLRRNESQTMKKPKPSFAWKRSSLLYEMWCFVKVCQILGTKYTWKEESWENVFGGQQDCPVLKSGATVCFYNEQVELYVQYDRTLPQSEKNTRSDDPLYMVKMQNGGVDHNKPDITIQMYSKEHGCYMGSIVIECKYRKIKSFWKEGMSRSSVGQLQTYYNNARSSYLYKEMGKRFNMNPVHQVIVLTPDIRENEVGPCNDFNIKIKSLRPLQSDELFEGMKQLLADHIEQALMNCSFLLGK